jgi:hypothetical protein
MLTGIYVLEDTKVTIQTGEDVDLIQLVVAGSSITQSTASSIPKYVTRELLLGRGIYKITSASQPAIHGDKIRTFTGKDPDPNPMLVPGLEGLTAESLNIFFYGSRTAPAKGFDREP